MVTVKQFAVLLVVGFLVCPLPGHSGVSPHPIDFDIHSGASSLFAQSSAQLFLREFNEPGVSFLLLDARTESVLAARWDDPAKRIPMGSLVKPFVAIAYGEKHEFRYPTHICKGEASGCWRAAGHGEIGIEGAIANSCNSYFRMLTKDMQASEIYTTTREFGLEDPENRLRGVALTGLGGEWTISPLQMARAYVELARRAEQPGVGEILSGMAQSAREGTGSKVGGALRFSRALVKTGTAACTHATRAPGDGFVVALYPADKPELLLLVRVHGVPGAKAAETAGQMLHRIEE